MPASECEIGGNRNLQWAGKLRFTNARDGIPAIEIRARKRPAINQPGFCEARCRLRAGSTPALQAFWGGVLS